MFTSDTSPVSYPALNEARLQSYMRALKLPDAQKRLVGGVLLSRIDQRLAAARTVYEAILATPTHFATRAEVDAVLRLVRSTGKLTQADATTALGDLVSARIVNRVGERYAVDPSP